MATPKELLLDPNKNIEQYLDPDKEYEFVDGQWEEKVMAGARHSGVGTRLLIEMGIHVKANNLGSLYGADGSFSIGKDERIPDISFLSIDRIPAEGEPESIWPIAPDLAVEVVSPNDAHEKVMSKIYDYFAAGVRQVWLISPEHKTLTIYHSPTKTTILTENDELISKDVLPGFRCQLREIFKNPAQAG